MMADVFHFHNVFYFISIMQIGQKVSLFCDWGGMYLLHVLTMIDMISKCVNNIRYYKMCFVVAMVLIVCS